MKLFYGYCLVCLLMIPGMQVASAEELSLEKRNDIVRLLDMTHALDIGQQMSEVVVSQLTAAVQEARPDIPVEMFDVLREEVNAVIREALPAFADMVVPVYHRNFSHEEIKGLLAFYETDLGKKTISTLPTLVRESMALGQQWGQMLGPVIQKRVLERFKTEGYDLAA